MKAFKKVIVMFIISAAIVIFWLAPGINKAEDSRYTRRYEDTDVRSVAVASRDTTGKELSGKSQMTTRKEIPSKVYKKESISSKATIRDITPKMYSRAIQFEKIELLDSLEEVASTKDTVTTFP